MYLLINMLYMNKEEIKDFLRSKRGYLKFGKNALAKQLKIKDIKQILSTSKTWREMAKG